MPTDGPELRMAAAFGLVAAGAVPVGLFGWWVGRRATPPPLPAPAADDPVIAFGYLMLFVGYQVAAAVLGQSAEANGLIRQAAGPVEPEAAGVWRAVFGSLQAALLMLAAWLWVRVVTRTVGSWRAVGRAVGVGVAGWLAVSPAVYVVHAVAERASAAVGVVPQEHPLVKVAAAADGRQAALLFASVALTTPFLEEVVFRGALLGWLVRRPAWSAVPVGLAALLALGPTDGRTRLMAAGFVLVLVAGLAAVRRRPKAVAVWATATLFAAVHVGVWPTPVPLFLLGLVLGWAAVRTGGVLAGTVLHGLFNAVSLVYLVRG